MFSNPIAALMRACRGGGSRGTPPSGDHQGITETTAAPPAPIEAPPPPDIIRKGKVLRRSDYHQERYVNVQETLFTPGGPRSVFAVAIEDEQGKEVMEIDQAVTSESTLVQPGDKVLVTIETRRSWIGHDSVYLRIDWSSEEN